MRLLLSGLIIAASGCGDDAVEGACNVQRFPVPGTSYSETSNYCASEAQCASYCGAVEGRSDVGHCGYDAADGDCYDGNLPPAPAPEMFCAVYRSIACGGGDDYQPHCDGYSCELALDSSDYDPGTGCTIRIGSGLGVGTTCDEALADLTGAAPDEAECPVAPDDTRCIQCSKQACCDAAMDCQDSPACVALVTCVTDCGTNEPCVQACADSHSGGVAALNAYFQCLDDRCTAACQ